MQDPLHDRNWIASHIPHQGKMCLLDQVLTWDSLSIVCRAISHRAADNPLRAHGRLGAACAIEYAAQAMALHGALLRPTAADLTRTGTGAGAGFGLLASAREVEIWVARLDDLHGDLRVSAQRLHSDTRGALYSFALHAEESLLVRGRASLLLDASNSSVDGAMP
jgi:predicted hotdog family 3-hydroxylacyl-ACP dehydratase